MKNDLFKIGEIAKMKDVTIKALRFYEKIGLLKPYFVDPDTRYRYYHASQLLYLDIIKAARNMDISPAKLVPYFTNKDSEGLLSLLNSHKEILFSKLYSLKKAIERVNEITNTLNTAQNTEKGIIYKKYIPERHALVFPFSMSKTDLEILADFSYLDALINKQRLNNCFEEGVLYSYTDANIVPEYIFMSISEKACQFTEYKEFSGGEYLCIVFDKSDAQQQVSKLLKYLTDNELYPQHVVQVSLLTDLFASEPEYFEMQAKI